jgi:hypothetical protein
VLGRLWGRTAAWPPTDELRRRTDERLLACGMAPDEFFDRERQKAREPQQVNFYRCLVRQPLDERWPESPACLPGQEIWRHYLAEWGVLAADEEDAVRRVLAWQGRCCPLPAQVLQVDLGSENFFDKPGVVWQGLRWSEAP